MEPAVPECNSFKMEVGKLDKLVLAGCADAVGWIELAAAALDWFKDELEVDSEDRRATLYAISAFCSRTTAVM